MAMGGHSESTLIAAPPYLQMSSLPILYLFAASVYLVRLIS